MCVLELGRGVVGVGKRPLSITCGMQTRSIPVVVPRSLLHPSPPPAWRTEGGTRSTGSPQGSRCTADAGRTAQWPPLPRHASTRHQSPSSTCDQGLRRVCAAGGGERVGGGGSHCPCSSAYNKNPNHNTCLKKACTCMKAAGISSEERSHLLTFQGME